MNIATLIGIAVLLAIFFMARTLRQRRVDRKATAYIPAEQEESRVHTWTEGEHRSLGHRY